MKRVTAASESFVPEHLRGSRAVVFAVCYAGPVEEGAEVVRPRRGNEPPAVDLIGPLPDAAVNR